MKAVALEYFPVDVFVCLAFRFLLPVSYS